MVNRKLVKFLSLRYKVLAAVLIVLAGGLVLLPKYEKHEGIDPAELLSHAISPERYISTDKLADILINKDPSYLLIDVRDEENLNNYSIPTSFNIPLKKLLEEDSESYLNQDEYDVILYSNDNFHSDQAWLLCNRLGYENLHVLKGGVNAWYNTIINPPKPTENMSRDQFELFSTRKAASMYFGVAYPEVVKKQPVVKKIIPKKVIPVKKKKKKMPEGGC